MSNSRSSGAHRALAVSAGLGTALAIVLAIIASRADPTPDKYTVQVPDGLSFSEFRGFEDWPTISVSQAENMIEVILGHPTIMEAYRSGAPFDRGKLTVLDWNGLVEAGEFEPTYLHLSPKAKGSAQAL